MILDSDLLSIQQAREIAKKAKAAQQEYQFFDQKQVDKIVEAMAKAGYEASEKLAKMALILCYRAAQAKELPSWPDKPVLKRRPTAKSRRS